MRAAVADRATAPLALPSPDWLKHRLTVSGPAAELAAFQAAAAGPGVVPWRGEPAALAEGWFNRMMAAPPAQRGVSVADARRLAERLSEAIAAWLVAAADPPRRAAACPFDLHALLPVPPEILALGPDDPAAIAWLWAHWGTTWPLRHVTARPVRTAREGHGRLLLRFHSADWSPWPALASIRARWPAVRFELRPDYRRA
jgi:hypothetical protein